MATLRLRGVDVALWRAGDEMLVQDITGRPEALAREPAPGAAAELSAIHLAPDQDKDIEEEITIEHEQDLDRDIDFSVISSATRCKNALDR